jgi:hypothetical protein
MYVFHRVVLSLVLAFRFRLLRFYVLPMAHIYASDILWIGITISINASKMFATAFWRTNLTNAHKPGTLLDSHEFQYSAQGVFLDMGPIAVYLRGPESLS